MTIPKSHPGQGHRARLREKFLTYGLTKFTDEEILELLLTLATPRQDCKQQARRLFSIFGSLRAVLDADAKELAQVEGIGPKNILGLKLVPAVSARYLEDRLVRGGRFTDMSEASDYFNLTMRHLTQEVFRVMLLDAEHRVKSVEDLFTGTLTAAVVYPREVVARALGAGAAALVCAHNHPGGNPTPSEEDRNLTRKLFFACQLAGLELLDHVIVGDDKMYSFSAAGLMRAWAQEYATLNL